MATTISSTTTNPGAGILTSPGIGSGLDVNGIVTKLMTVEQLPLNQLNQQEATNQAKISAYGTLSSSVASLKSAVDALGDSSLYTHLSATASDSTVLSATANSVAKAGTYSINVVALASAQTLTSQTFTSSSDAVTTAGGKLKFEIGTFASGTFAASSSATPVTVDIAANSSLSSIRDQINSANAGVTAKLISVDSSGTQFKLSITSNTTGAAGSLRITALDTTGSPLPTNNTDLAKLAYDPTKTAGAGNEYAVAAAAQDAHIQVDGVDLFRNSNVIGDAITGVSLTVSKAGGQSSLTVAADTTAVNTAIQTFVTNYNATVALGRQLSNYDSSTQTAAVLTGDSAARNLLSQLSQMISTSGPGTSSAIKNLSDIGLTLQRDGSLKLDSVKLQSSLQSSLPSVGSLLTSTTSSATKGIATQMSSRLDAILGTNGLIASSISGVQSLIKDIGTQRTNLQQRLVQVEANYRQQFSALDTLVASMQQTSQYLTQQLASLVKTTG